MPYSTHPCASSPSPRDADCRTRPYYSSFSATIVKAAYGLEIAESKDKNIALMESVLEGFQAFAPGRFLVQYLPILEHVPLWTPIAGRQLQELSVWRRSAHRVKQTLFNITEKAVVRASMKRNWSLGYLSRLTRNIGRRCCTSVCCREHSTGGRRRTQRCSSRAEGDCEERSCDCVRG